MPTLASAPRVATRTLPAVAVGLSLSVLAACGSSAGGESATTGSTHSQAASATGTSAPTEQRKAVPRLVATYEGGVMVLDADSFDVVADLPKDGFLRVNPVGDGRHVSVTTADGFTMLDTGTWGEPHGDHAHHYTAAPAFTGVTIPAKKGGHVVVHDGRTVFFDDGTGRITIVDKSEAAKPASQKRTLETDDPHHGVAVATGDGTVVQTVGTSEKRVGLLARDESGKEIARTRTCPGVHGEAASDKALVFGCENGAVVFADGSFRQVTAPDPYGRIGNQKGSPLSPVTLGDYKVDKDATLERPTRVSLIDTRTAALKLVDLPSSYSFRSLGRGPRGEALVLGTDGNLHVIDPVSGRIEKSLPVVGAWQESEDWHDPRPTLFTLGNTAYVTEPSSKRMVRVDMLGWSVTGEGTLPHPTDEITGVSGGPAGSH